MLPDQHLLKESSLRSLKSNVTFVKPNSTLHLKRSITSSRCIDIIMKNIIVHGVENNSRSRFDLVFSVQLWLMYLLILCFTFQQMHETHVKSDHFSEAKKIESKSPETFSCDRCVAVFYKKDVYESHITQYHHYTFQYFLNNVSVLPPSKKIIINCVGDVQSAYYCHLCGYEYVLKYNLQVCLHINYVIFLKISLVKI